MLDNPTPVLRPLPDDHAAKLFRALEDFDNWFSGFNPDCRASRQEGRFVVIRARKALADAKEAGVS
jgi:hypothetical protein